MNRKKIKTIALLSAVLLMLAITSCGKSETTETNLPVNQDKVLEEKSPEVLEKETVSDNDQDKNPANKPQETTDLEHQNPSSDTPESNVQPQTPKEPEKPIDTPTPSTEPTIQAASAYIGKSASALVASIGQPTGKTYVTSCIGDGDDGEWYYADFTVYTYRDPNGNEKIIDVLGN